MIVFVNISDVLVLSENDEDDEIRQVNLLRMKSYGISSNLLYADISNCSEQKSLIALSMGFEKPVS